MNLFDLRHTLRRLLRSPAFSAISILLLGLAFGAFACVFSVVYGLLYKPLPYPQSEQIVSLESRIIGLPFNVGLSVPLLDEVAHNAQTLDGVAAYRTGELALRDEAGQRIGMLHSARVEPALLGLLGAQPALGRLFTAEDAVSGAADNAILSWDEWQQRFSGSSDAIGQRMSLDGRDYRVVGVMPKGFVFPSSRTRLWTPLAFSTDERDRATVGSFDGLMALGRLRADVTPDAATSELAVIAKSITELEGAFGGGFRMRVEPLRSLWIGERREALLLMLLAVSMVWLVTAANVANLFLAQALARRHETALTAALGAAPWRRARAALIEVVMLCGAGVLLGCALLPAGLALLSRFDLLPRGTPQTIGIDAPTLAIVAVLAVALCTVLTLARLSAQGGNLNDMLRRGSSRQTPGGAAQTARRALVVAQVALTVALLFGIGVLLRSSQNLLAESIGFQRDHLLYVSLDDLIPMNAAPDLRAARLTQLVERAAALPGAEVAGLGSMVPFGSSTSTSSFTPPGQEGTEKDQIAYDQKIDAGYFRALDVQILRGRNFSADEVRSSAALAIVDELFVKRHFGDADPLGRHFLMGTGPKTAPSELTIIGVVPTLKQRALDEQAERVSIYRPDPAPPHAALVLRTTVDPSVLIAPLKALGAEIASKDAIGPIIAMNERIADTLRDRTRLNTLLGLLGVIALLLAAVGLYAVLAYAVRLRVPEFGVRMALGARASHMLRHVLGQGLSLVGIGLVLGLPLAWAFARMLSAKLYGVGTLDLPTLMVVAAVLAAIGLVACWWPARRASRVDPVVALRDE